MPTSPRAKWWRPLHTVRSPVDQAIEQQLRRVPDDPSGLLRARIRQHYAQTYRGS